jgi:hypothetical protein
MAMYSKGQSSCLPVIAAAGLAMVGTVFMLSSVSCLSTGNMCPSEVTTNLLASVTQQHGTVARPQMALSSLSTASSEGAAMMPQVTVDSSVRAGQQHSATASSGFVADSSYAAGDVWSGAFTRVGALLAAPVLLMFAFVMKAFRKQPAPQPAQLDSLQLVAGNSCAGYSSGCSAFPQDASMFGASSPDMKKFKPKCIHPDRPVSKACADCPRRR